jgi:hypothetical protein
VLPAPSAAAATCRPGPWADGTAIVARIKDVQQSVDAGASVLEIEFSTHP